MSNSSFSVTGPVGFSSVFKGIPSCIGCWLFSRLSRTIITHHFAGREIDVSGVNNVADDVDISSRGAFIANRLKLRCVIMAARILLTHRTSSRLLFSRNLHTISHVLAEPPC